jgi:dipeptidyl aminopeptidase/acylaminoacyl peptidase
VVRHASLTVCGVAVLVIDLTFALAAAHAKDDPPEGERRAIEALDAIEMTRIVLPDEKASVGSSPASFSPSGSRFVVVTAKGNVAKDTNDYSLLMFSAESTEPQVLASLSTSSNRPGIHDVQWIDDNTLAFLGENRGEVQQLYKVDCVTKTISKLTNHRTNLIAYSINLDRGEVQFLAEREVKRIPDTEPGGSGMVVSSEPLTDLILGENRWTSSQFSDLFVTRLDTGEEWEITNQTDFEYPKRIWSSPGGRYVVSTSVAKDVPEIWGNYEDWSLKVRTRTKPLRGDSRRIRQLVLVDVKTGQVRPLIDAPLADRSAAPDVLWMPDGNSVLISGVYLPLTGRTDVERNFRKSTLMIAEVKIPSLVIVPVSPANMCVTGCLLSWNADSRNLLVKSGDHQIHSAPVRAFHVSNATWREVRPPPSEGDDRSTPTITLEQDMNTPPKLFVATDRMRRKALLLDPNPQFKSRQFASVRDITFTATDGHPVRAGLYMPETCARTDRCPLVIQTHGWHPESFWIDGPWPSAFSAQPLASKGCVVLQLSEDVSDAISSTPQEAPKEASAYEGGIAYLDRQGVIDRDRVGVIGFSRSGLGVEDALVHSKYHYAAATLAEPSDAGYFFYIAILPSFSWRWPDLEGVNGGVPFGDGMDSWLKNSPGFNLARVTTPVREEAYSPIALFLSWEWYAGLSRLAKPVDLIYIRDGEHVLVRPSDRLTSQQGNVDWFDFWLNGHERTEPVAGSGESEQSLSTQYARWEHLCDLQRAGNPDKPTYCVGSKH